MKYGSVYLAFAVPTVLASATVSLITVFVDAPKSPEGSRCLSPPYWVEFLRVYNAIFCIATLIYLGLYRGLVLAQESQAVQRCGWIVKGHVGIYDFVNLMLMTGLKFVGIERMIAFYHQRCHVLFGDLGPRYESLYIIATAVVALEFIMLAVCTAMLLSAPENWLDLRATIEYFVSKISPRVSGAGNAVGGDGRPRFLSAQADIHMNTIKSAMDVTSDLAPSPVPPAAQEPVRKTRLSTDSTDSVDTQATLEALHSDPSAPQLV